MENLNREAILRMLSGKTGNSSSGGGGGGIDLAGYATSIWVTENFVSIEFFRELFKAYDSNGNEVMPNDTETTINNIKAMFGFWTEQYLSTLGQGSGGGGGGGASSLSELLDVALNQPSDGQSLVYDASISKWVNRTVGGTDMATVWNALSVGTSEQINVSHLTNALSGYVTTSAISDMATQTWVGQQGFATQTWVNSNFITIAYFDRLFRAYNGSTLVSHNDTTSTINNIKAMFGFWTDFYLSALGTGGASSVSISLSQLADVTLTSPTAGQALVYDATNNKWVNGTIQTGVSTLSSLTDVLLTSPTANQVLIWDSASSKWVNTSLKTINFQSIIGSGDIQVGGGGSQAILPYYLFTRYDTTSSYAGYIGRGSGGNNDIQLVSYTDNKISIETNGGVMFITKKYHNSNPALGALDDGTIGFISNSSTTGAVNAGYGTFFWSDYWSGCGSFQSGYTDGTTTPLPLALQPLGGNVGIGTKLPQFELDVNGISRTIYLCFYDTSMNNTCGYIGRGSNSTNEIQIASYMGDLELESASRAAYMLLSSSGLIGVNISSPQYPFHIVNKTNGWTANCESPNSAVWLSNNEGNGIYIGSKLNNASVYLLKVAASQTTLGSGGSTRFIVKSNGAIGIDTDSPYYELHVGGSIYATGAVTALSDARHKTIIKDVDMSVEDIAWMPAVMYKWNDGREDKELHVGSIAQNWQTILPEVVLKANDEEGTLSMQYGVAALVSSIIIARKVVNHEERIKQLEKENKELKLKLKIA